MINFRVIIVIITFGLNPRLDLPQFNSDNIKVTIWWRQCVWCYLHFGCEIICQKRKEYDFQNQKKTLFPEELSLVQLHQN